MTRDDGRPTPEALLETAKAEERREHRGRLRIFLGAAAGVGKTYAMLEAAREQRAQGRSVLVGLIETHGRRETEALLAGFEVLPRRHIEYRGVALAEMDLDAALARRPQLAVVDELAHTNAPGSRHARRYQDVDELLAAGIDVYTTLNIQHVESLNDVVAQITGVRVRETIPDKVLENADEIDLVDLPPDELIGRLRDGKVYVPDQAAQAVRKFFRPGNLSALRELALRYVAGRVDEQMRSYMGAHAIPGPWPAGERVLVCIGPDAAGERLIRVGRRLADGLDAEWWVLHVEAASGSAAARAQISRSLRLAEELGARTATIPGADVVEDVIRFAQANNVTKIVAGASRRPLWKRLFSESVVEQLIRASGNIDVYVIGRASEGSLPAPAPTPPVWRHYAYSVAAVLAATALGWPLYDRLDPPNITMIYLLAVVVVALQWGRGPAVLAAALGALAFDVFFVPPRFTVVVNDTQYLLTFAGLIVVGSVISALTGRAQDQARAARQRSSYATALSTLSAELAAARDLGAIVDAVGRNAMAICSARISVYLAENGRLSVRFTAPGSVVNDHEIAVATWTLQHGEAAGHGTETLPAAAARYLPLKTAKEVAGVLGVQAGADGAPTPEQWELLEAFARLAAVAIERVQLAEAARRIDALREAEKLQEALLGSISHDLRTPLASITGALSTLADDATRLDEPARRELIDTAADQARRLNVLVGHLLDMTRLEAGALTLRRDPVDVQDLIGTVLTRFGDALAGRQVSVSVSEDLPAVSMDFVLMGQAVSNVLDNAIKYSPAGSAIDITAAISDGELRLQIGDRGPGVPPAELGRIFQKFHRIRRPADAGGVGLGLSISAGIVDLHGGRIWAENRADGGGTLVTLAVPLDRP